MKILAGTDDKCLLIEDEFPKTQTKQHQSKCGCLQYLLFLVIFLVFGVVLYTTSPRFMHDNYKYTDDGNEGTHYIRIVIQKIFWTVSASDDKSTVEDYANKSPQCSIVPDSLKFDCYPDAPVTQSQCLSRGCCWKQSGNVLPPRNFPPLGVPYCYYPSNYLGYSVSDIKKTSTGLQAVLHRITPSGFPNDIQTLNFSVSFLDEMRLRIKITDLNMKRYEVHVPDLSHVKIKSSFQPLYEVDLSPNGNLRVTRKSTGTALFNTNISTLVYADQFLQLSTQLPSNYIYGLGEHKSSLLKSTNWTRYTFFNRDRSPVVNMNTYGSHPFYLSMENDGNSHGVFLFNSNSMDVVLQPTPAATFRTIGGILDFFVFLGPTPSKVIQQYLQYIGLPAMPPFWGLGFHLCRYGYNTLNNTKKVWQRTRDAMIPFDVQWNDIDYMDKDNDFSYDHKRFSGLPDFVNEVHETGMHYVVMTDPGISAAEPPGTYPPFDDGIAADIFIKNSTGQLFIGKVWNWINTVFPDFTNPEIIQYWTKQIRSFHDTIPFDGLWIDMNEPSNFYDGTIDGCPSNSSLEHPPYVPGGIEPLYTKTVCMSAKQYLSEHYNVHNLYGITETVATNIALSSVLQKRPFIISRSTFPGQGHYGAHWDGDISSSWDDMKWTIPSIINFNMFGIPFIGADICGFNGNTTVELCARWSQLGAFYPFSRNHNSDGNIDQDPVALGPLVTTAAKISLLVRYQLLPYLYTLMYRSHAFGETVARSLFFEYPNDKRTYSIDRQFMWGPALIIIPVLDPGVETVSGYLPEDTWLVAPAGKLINSTGNDYVFPASFEVPNLAWRCGYITPCFMPYGANGTVTTTTQLRKQPFALLAVLCPSGEANGELFWDDGDSIDTYNRGVYNLLEFSIRNNTLQSVVVKNAYSTTMILEVIEIIGIKQAPTSVTLNQKPVVNFFYNPVVQMLVISQTDLSFLEPITVTWT